MTELLTILQKYFSLEWCRAQSKGGVKNPDNNFFLILLTLMPNGGKNNMISYLHFASLQYVIFHSYNFMFETPYLISQLSGRTISGIWLKIILSFSRHSLELM